MWIKNLGHRLFFCLRKPVVRVYEARLTGDGNLIGIRYWLSRPDKLNPGYALYLTLEETGEKMGVLRIPKFGVARTFHASRQHIGNALFYNRDGLVKPGSTMTLHLDGLAAAGIVVR